MQAAVIIHFSVLWLFLFNLLFFFKGEFDGFIKCIQACEKEIKVKTSISILLIEKVILLASKPLSE